jgi:hypothetical protein
LILRLIDCSTALQRVDHDSIAVDPIGFSVYHDHNPYQRDAHAVTNNKLVRWIENGLVEPFVADGLDALKHCGTMHSPHSLP